MEERAKDKVSANSKFGKNESQNGGKAVVQGMGNSGMRPVSPSLIVASKHASLYLRQDEQTEKLARLFRVDALIPLARSDGGNDWYIVKTPEGYDRFGQGIGCQQPDLQIMPHAVDVRSASPTD